MKKIYLTMLICIFCISVNGQQAAGNLNNKDVNSALVIQNRQTMTVINHSTTVIYFNVGAKDVKNAKTEYSSLASMIKPNSKIELGTREMVQWAHDAAPQSYRFTSFSGSYIDPSGACTVEATNVIGGSADKLQQNATISAGSCGNESVTLSWSMINGRATVTID